MRQREVRTSSSLTHARIDIERGVSDGPGKGEDQGSYTHADLPNGDA